MIDVEILVSEGGHWLKLQVSEETLIGWLNVKYGKPRFESHIDLWAVKFQAIDRTMVCHFGSDKIWSFQ
jgi:hypothetical protein